MGEAGKWFIYVHKGDDKQSEGRTGGRADGGREGGRGRR